MRDELYLFFDTEIVNIIKNDNHSPELCKIISQKFNGKFSVKYSYVARQYKDTIRISATYKPLGIVFFMAQSKNGSEHHQFVDPCYFGNIK